MSLNLTDTIAAALDFALSGRGFARTARADAGDARADVCDARWVRALRWKRDVVELVQRRADRRITVNLHIEIPAGGRFIAIDANTVDAIVGRRDGYLSPEGLFRAWKRRRLVFDVDRDTRLAVDWFAEYDSPRRALDKLRSAGRNGCTAGSDPHRAVVAFLEGVGEDYPSRRELIETFAREVPSVFGPLAARHGLRFREIEARLFTIESDDVRVRIRFGSGHVPGIDLVVGRASARVPHYEDVDIVGPPVVPSVEYTARPLQSFADVRQEIAKAAAAMEKVVASGFSRTGRL